MKQLLITIAAVVLVGCGDWQQSTPAPETRPVDPVAEVPAQSPSPKESQPTEPVAETATLEPPSAKAPDISIHEAAGEGNIEAVKQHLAASTDVNVKNKYGVTSLHRAALVGNKETVELLIAKGADVNAKDKRGGTPLDSTLKPPTSSASTAAKAVQKIPFMLLLGWKTSKPSNSTWPMARI